MCTHRHVDAVGLHESRQVQRRIRCQNADLDVVELAGGDVDFGEIFVPVLYHQLASQIRRQLRVWNVTTEVGRELRAIEVLSGEARLPQPALVVKVVAVMVVVC